VATLLFSSSWLCSDFNICGNSSNFIEVINFLITLSINILLMNLFILIL